MFLILAAVSPCHAKYSGGTGEPNTPYQIANVADLMTLANDANDYNKCFILTTDVNFGGLSLTPVGNDSTKFTGVFDGNDNIISNAVIDQPGSDYIGLFGYVGSDGQILNLGVENVTIYGRDFVGGLVGENLGTLTSCYATGSVSGNSSVGGLVGDNLGTLTSCYATGSVTGTYLVGGLVGSNDGSLTACYATGSVTGTGRVGGLVGDNESGSITTCYATGSVTGTDSVGGLVGFNVSGLLTACYATGSVTGINSGVGGLVGDNFGTLTFCYATGSVSGNSSVGGLVGGNFSTLTSCYATGSVTGTGEDSYYVGGLVGLNYGGTLTSCFWDTNTSSATVGVGYGYGTSTGVTGKTTVEMKQQASFVEWDFNDVWHICETTNYPKLKWQILPGDFVCPDGVDFYDLIELCDQWLFEEVPADLAPPGGDGIVNFADFAVFAGNWGISNDIYALFDFTEQWLKTGLPVCSADISPLPGGDGRVNFADFALMANNWLKGF